MRDAVRRLCFQEGRSGMQGRFSFKGRGPDRSQSKDHDRQGKDLKTSGGRKKSLKSPPAPVRGRHPDVEVRARSERNEGQNLRHPQDDPRAQEFTKGLPGSSKLREKLNRIKTWEEIEKMMREMII